MVIGMKLRGRQAQSEAFLILCLGPRVKLLQRLAMPLKHPIKVIQNPLGVGFADKQMPELAGQSQLIVEVGLCIGGHGAP